MIYTSLFLDRTKNITITGSRLPHWHQDAKIQFVTIRLGDSLPQYALDDLRQKKAQFLKSHKIPLNDNDVTEYHNVISQKEEEWLNANYGSCILRNIENAKILRNVMLKGDRIKYYILDYVIMPNHVHALFIPQSGIVTSEILKIWKGVSSREIGKRMKTDGRLWHKESFDRIVRSEQHLKHIIDYISENVSKGGVLWKDIEGRNK